jgi:hypothetical protein
VHCGSSAGCLPGLGQPRAVATHTATWPSSSSPRSIDLRRKQNYNHLPLFTEHSTERCRSSSACSSALQNVLGACVTTGCRSPHPRRADHFQMPRPRTTSSARRCLCTATKATVSPKKCLMKNSSSSTTSGNSSPTTAPASAVPDSGGTSSRMYHVQVDLLRGPWRLCSLDAGPCRPEGQKNQKDPKGRITLQSGNPFAIAGSSHSRPWAQPSSHRT